MEKLYTVEEIAERYGVVKRTVWVWIRENKLAAIKTGKFYRVKQSELEKFENGNKTA